MYESYATVCYACARLRTYLCDSLQFNKEMIIVRCCMCICELISAQFMFLLLYIDIYILSLNWIIRK